MGFHLRNAKEQADKSSRASLEEGKHCECENEREEGGEDNTKKEVLTKKKHVVFLS